MSNTWLPFISFYLHFLLLLHILSFSAFTSYLTHLPLTPLLPPTPRPPRSLPSHVKVPVYWTGLKLSASLERNALLDLLGQIEFPLTGHPEWAHSRLKGTQTLPPSRMVTSACQYCLTWSLLPAHTHTLTCRAFLSCCLGSSDTKVGGKYRVIESKQSFKGHRLRYTDRL